MNKQIEEIDRKIKELKCKKEQLKKEIKMKNLGNNKTLLRRLSPKFYDSMCYIDKKREESGLDNLSLPEKTELVIRHKSWIRIQDDIIGFNRNLQENGGITIQNVQQ